MVYKIHWNTYYKAEFYFGKADCSSQSGFIARRFILDGTATVQEHMAAQVTEKTQQGALLKPDFAEAYDILD